MSKPNNVAAARVSLFYHELKHWLGGGQESAKFLKREKHRADRRAVKLDIRNALKYNVRED